MQGFSLSSGRHDILVPQFYLLEYRDPYQQYASGLNYDNSLQGPGFTFFRNAATGAMEAVDFRYRSGVLLWYYNGSYLWSQNEPSRFGAGNGFLLLVDPNPQEFALAGLPSVYYQNDAGWRFYQFGADAQALFKQAFVDVMCFQRRPAYYPVDMQAEDRATCTDTGPPPGEQLYFDGRPLLYSYTLSNEILPGAAREAYKSMGSLLDYRVGNEGLSYRLYDRLLRSKHSADAAFSLDDFSAGLQYYAIQDDTLVPVRAVPYPTLSHFSDADPSRYLNPHLPFGSAAIPSEGLSFDLAQPGPQAPEQARVKVYFNWER